MHLNWREETFYWSRFFPILVCLASSVCSVSVSSSGKLGYERCRKNASAFSGFWFDWRSVVMDYIFPRLPPLTSLARWLVGASRKKIWCLEEHRISFVKKFYWRRVTLIFILYFFLVLFLFLFFLRFQFFFFIYFFCRASSLHSRRVFILIHQTS